MADASANSWGGAGDSVLWINTSFPSAQLITSDFFFFFLMGKTASKPLWCCWSPLLKAHGGRTQARSKWGVCAKVWAKHRNSWMGFNGLVLPEGKLHEHKCLFCPYTYIY